MMQIKKQREINEARKREYEQRMRHENQVKHNEIMAQKIMAEQRKKEMMEQKMRFFKMQYEQRLREEEEAKAKRELEVLNMEKLEMELIKKLQHTQMIQKSAYEELETALANNPEEFAKKYGVQRVDGRTMNRKLSTRNSVSPLHREEGKGDILSGLNDSKDMGSYKGVPGSQPESISQREANAEQAVLQKIENRVEAKKKEEETATISQEKGESHRDEPHIEESKDQNGSQKMLENLALGIVRP